MNRMEGRDLIAQMMQTADAVTASLPRFLDQFFPPKDEETERSYHTCSVLAEGAIKNYQILRSALLSESQWACALGCRNLLEIRIVTNYVLLSKENAMSIAHDRLIDGKQLASSLKYLELRLNPGLATSQFDKKIAEFDKKMQDEGITRKNYKSTTEMAQAIDLADEYRRMNTLCSS